MASGIPRSSHIICRQRLWNSSIGPMVITPTANKQSLYISHTKTNLPVTTAPPAAGTTVSHMRVTGPLNLAVCADFHATAYRHHM
ncbi:hypothetical protein GDO81_000820 [Engystomops pustulosus]|uniref:Uncharacterized protein n=1 Tax=Engystomops pustulosus TaxID=76066 RepID=A0AAV7D8X7_ENGPU|nr:hypothetical protein GDO81_011602 [Engystomops pustulosus]KAG8593415.1 hypothetical protein GDO81_000820 [Engystomops pustulosus]